MAEEIVTIFKADSKQYEESLKTQIALVTQKATVEAKTANKEKANLTEAETAAKKRVTFIKEEIQDLDELKKRRALASNPKDIEEYNKRISETEKRIKTVKGATDEAADATSRFGKIGQDAFGLLDKITLGLAGKFKKLIGTVASVTKGMSGLKAAIVATGIGALLLIVGGLVSAFTATQKGADTLGKAMAGLGGGFSNLRKEIGLLIINIGENNDFWKKFITRVIDTQGVLGALISIYREGAVVSMELFERTKLLELKTAALGLASEKTKSKIKALNLIGTDTTKTFKEREEAIIKAIELDETLLNGKIRLAREELKTARLVAIASKGGENERDSLIAVFHASTELYKLQQESLELQTTLNIRLNEIKKQERLADEKTAAEELARIKAEEAAKIALFELNARLIEEAANNEIVELDILLAQKKIDQEQYAKESVAIEAIRLEQIARLYGEDSDEYKQALLDKLAAEQAYSDETDAIFKEFFDEGDRIENIRLNKRDETRKKQAKLDEDAAELKKQQDEDAFDSGLELAGELGSILEEGSANRIAAIEQESEARQQAGDQELNRLYSELAVAQGADQARILSAIQVQRNLLKIQTEADAESLRKEKQRAKNFKRIQLVTTTIQEAVAIGRGFAELGPIGGPIAAVGLAIKFAALLATIESQEFAKGTDYVKAANSSQGRKVDDVPAMLTVGEAVIPVDKNKKHKGLVASIIGGNSDDFINRNYILPKIQAEIMNKGGVDVDSINLSNKWNDQNIVSWQRKQIEVERSGVKQIVTAIQSNKRHSRDVA